MRHALRGSGLVLVGATVVNGANFAFNALIARLLGPTHYGTVAAVVVLLYVSSPMLLSLQTVTSRVTSDLVAAGRLADVRALGRAFLPRLIALALLIALAITGASIPLAQFVHVPSWHPIALLGIAIALSIGTHVQRGVLQGSSSFGRFAASTSAEGIAKVLVAAAVVTLLWRDANGAVLGIVAAVVVSLALGVQLMRVVPRPAGDAHPGAEGIRALTRGLVGYSLMTLGTMTLLSLMLSLDVIAAKHYLPATVAGLYAAVSLTGKIAFFATSSIGTYSFPLFSARMARQENTAHPFALSLAAVGATGLAIAVVFFAAPTLVITPLFGHAYAAAAPYAGWMALAVTCYAIVYQSAMFLLARKQAGGLYVLGLLVGLQAALFYAIHGSMLQLVGVQLVVFGAGAAAMGLLCMQSAMHTHAEVVPVGRA